MAAPTPAQLKAANMAPMPNLAVIVEENGDKVRQWDARTEKFTVVTGPVLVTTQLYAVANSWLVPTPPPPPPAVTTSLHEWGSEWSQS